MDPKGVRGDRPRAGRIVLGGRWTHVSFRIHLRRFQNLCVVDGDHIHRRAHLDGVLGILVDLIGRVVGQLRHTGRAVSDLQAPRPGRP